MQLKRLLAGVAIASISSAALADGRSAAHNLFTNLSKANLSIGAFNEGNVYVTSTLVRRMYALTSTSGEFLGYVNEGGTVYGDKRGFRVLSTDSAPLRPMTAEETAAFRLEVMAAIDRDKLIKVDYGKTVGGNSVEFSAVDCPACKGFEELINKKNLALTVYIVPSSLQPIQKGGAMAWQKAANLWCNSNGGNAWKAYWASGAAPANGTCPFADPRVAESAEENLQGILEGVGVNVMGTPAVVAADGSIVNGGRSKADKLPASTVPSHWLDGGGDGVQLASAENPYTPQRVNAAWSPGAAMNAGGAQPRQTPGKINLGTALKGLFGK